ncbi:putative ribonuclease h protein [Quercus suber]|uniref:Ribonuclease h protein n=1 Tax=Quercus suber TaxID=58331 RepID=A0AAW0LDR6_QUESU
MQTRELMYCVLEPNMGKDRCLRQVQWLKLADGWHKLNMDGSVVSSCGLVGCGGLLRDSAGQWVVGFAKSICSSSSIAAELWALREGLGLCLERGITAVEIELDATVAISLVSSNVNAKGDLSERWTSGGITCPNSVTTLLRIAIGPRSHGTIDHVLAHPVNFMFKNELWFLVSFIPLSSVLTCQPLYCKTWVTI